MSSESTFNRVIALFNQSDQAGWKDLEPLLDDKVVVKKVDDPDAIGPKKTLLNYLRGMQEKPFMDPGQYDVHPVSPRAEVISGSGGYKDDAAATLEPFAYTFVFSQNKQDQWQL